MKTLIGIPTLNEKLNVSIIYKKIRKFDKKSDILFFDDNSKDGTNEEIKKIISKDSKVFLKTRLNKFGIGSAHKEIIKYSFKKKISYTYYYGCRWYSRTKIYISNVEKD